VRAELSPVLPRPLADQLIAALPRAELVEVPGAYHHLTLDAPSAVSKALDPFLERLKEEKP
jgi:pimeloyl-ACP methyl ester carboxylesterase